MQKGYLLNIWHGKHTLITLLEDVALDVHEDGHNNSFSLGMGHDSILESAEETMSLCVYNCDH
jgi:hypothetical protein